MKPMEAMDTGVGRIGGAPGPCEDCPDPGQCMALDECEVDVGLAGAIDPFYVPLAVSERDRLT